MNRWSPRVGTILVAAAVLLLWLLLGGDFTWAHIAGGLVVAAAIVAWAPLADL